MRALDGPSLRGFDYSMSRRLSEDRLLARSTVRVSRTDGALSTDPARLAGPFDLPPGRFAARIVVDGAAARERRGCRFGRDRRRDHRSREARPTGPRRWSSTCRFRLRCGWRLTGRRSPRPCSSIEIVPEAIVPRRSRAAVDVHALETIDARPGAFLVYADANTFPENGVFWTQGTSAGKVSGGARRRVDAGPDAAPRAGRRRGAPDGRRSGSFGDAGARRNAGRSRSRSRRRLASCRWSSKRRDAFGPSDHEPGSTDRRWLGCQVRVGLR